MADVVERPWADDLVMNTDRTADRKDRTMDLTTAQANLAAAQADLDAAKAVVDAARRADYEARMTARADRNVAADTDAFVDPNPGRHHRADYILPLGAEYAKSNVLDPDTFAFGGAQWTANSTVYVMSKPERTRPTRAFMSGGGGVGDDWRIGNVWECHHDQTGANLGTYTVVGIVVYGTDGQVIRTVGEVPATKLSVSVFK